MSAAIDHEARRAATLANQKIDAHEDKCAERWRQARDAQRNYIEVSARRALAAAGHVLRLRRLFPLQRASWGF